LTLKPVLRPTEILLKRDFGEALCQIDDVSAIQTDVGETEYLAVLTRDYGPPPWCPAMSSSGR
jgi:hypothetical protein